jgi:hypothetical protein
VSVVNSSVVNSGQTLVSLVTCAAGGELYSVGLHATFQATAVCNQAYH